MSAITISRLKGSGGREIGKKVAEKLDYFFVDKRTIQKIFLEYGFQDFPEAYESIPGFWDRFDKRHNDIMNFLEQVTQAVAKYGDVVILGRGSFAMFPNYSDVLNVRLWAPFDIRVNRIMERDSIKDKKEAEDIIESSDNTRRAFIEPFLQRYGNRERAFDINIDTDKVPINPCVNFIVKAAEFIKDKQRINMDFTGNLDVDPRLMDAVGDVLLKKKWD